MKKLVDFARKSSVIAITACVIGSSTTALAQSNTCRVVVSNHAGPEQPRAVSGLNNDQIGVFDAPEDIYGGKAAVGVRRIGQSVNLATPYEEKLVADGNTSNAVIMVAINDGGTKRWIPVTNARKADGKPEAPSNLAYCTVRGMW